MVEVGGEPYRSRINNVPLTPLYDSRLHYIVFDALIIIWVLLVRKIGVVSALVSLVCDNS